MIPPRNCPNCNSRRFQETVSREYCPDCGLECDYHGKGANQVYEDMMDRKARVQQKEQEDEDFRIWWEHLTQ